VAIVAVPDEPMGDEGVGRTPALRLTTPRGYVVEGLDVGTVAVLLRVVG
jgi:hypothetical protein